MPWVHVFILNHRLIALIASSSVDQFLKLCGHISKAAPLVSLCFVLFDSWEFSKSPNIGRRFAISLYRYSTQWDLSFHCCSCSSCSFSSLRYLECNYLAVNSISPMRRHQQISIHFQLHFWRSFKFWLEKIGMRSCIWAYNHKAVIRKACCIRCKWFLATIFS